jgi:hypothetical protein
MKRLLALTVILLLTGIGLHAQNITVTQPAAGAVWDIGSTYTIRWTHSGRMINTVKIVLVAVPGGPDPIEDSTANDDAYEWPITASVAPGTYFVRIKTTDDGVKGESGHFTIRDASAPPPAYTLRITHPSAGENFCLNKSNEITWEQGNTAGLPVGIRLLQTGHAPRPIIASNENTGRFAWTPEAGTPAGLSQIEIFSAADRTALGTSALFNLTTCITAIIPLQSSTPCMTVQSPAAGAHLPVGQYAEVRWNTAAAGCGDVVQLTAIRLADNFEIAIRGGVGNVSGNHTYSWLIDRGRFINHTGQYRIRLNSNSGATALSPVFEVTAYIEENATPQQDLILSIDPSSVEFTRLVGDADPHNFIFRLRATLRMMNASRRPAGGPFPMIREVKCNWRVQLERNGVWETMNLDDVSDDSRFNGSQPFWVGPFYSGAWTTQHITIDFHVWHYTRLRRRILFQLDPDQEINDPVRSNNTAYSTGFDPPNAD